MKICKGEKIMKTEKINLWKNVPGMCLEMPMLTVYVPECKTSRGAVIICPGGAYVGRAEHEGKGYAEFLAEHGYTAFVLDYRVTPHKFPLPLLDARRAIRYVRFWADEYGIDKNNIAIMGSSAGGHLAAMTSTYYEPIEFENIDEIDKEDFIPNAQILCYPVIKLLGKGRGHIGSGKNLLGELLPEMGEELSPDLIATEKTPKAFIWHTFADEGVNVINTLDYARRLRMVEVPVECHIFPEGPHGLGLATGDDEVSRHVSQWGSLLINWLKYINF